MWSTKKPYIEDNHYLVIVTNVIIVGEVSCIYTAVFAKLKPQQEERLEYIYNLMLALTKTLNGIAS